nr:pentatricopeptide repeat-containing protein [Quercus suber]
MDLNDVGFIEPRETIWKIKFYMGFVSWRTKIEPDVITLNDVVNGLCKVGKLNKAGDVIEDMKAWGFSTNVVTYNTLIDGYCKMGRVGKMYKAESILKDMVANHVYPNEVTYNILIDGFCKDENVLATKKVFEEMQR